MLKKLSIRLKRTHQGRHVHGPKLIFGHGEGHDRAIRRGQTLVRELFVERNVRVPIDRGKDAGIAILGEGLDLTDDRLVVLVVEGGVFLRNVGLRHALGDQVGLQDLVRSAVRCMTKCNGINSNRMDRPMEDMKV